MTSDRSAAQPAQAVPSDAAGGASDSGAERQVREQRAIIVRPRLEPTAQPIATLLVQRIERTQRDPTGVIAKASVRLHYRLVHPRADRGAMAGGTFDAGYSAAHDAVSLSSTSMMAGSIFVDPPWLRGERVGTYLMAQLVAWAKRIAPTARINPITALANQAGADNIERRDRFYRQFGIAIDYDNEQRTHGVSDAVPVADLIVSEAWRANIAEHDALDYVGYLLEHERELGAALARQTQRSRTLQDEADAARKHPWRWLFAQLLR